MPCKGKQQYLLTFQVSRYCCLPLPWLVNSSGNRVRNTRAGYLFPTLRINIFSVSDYNQGHKFDLDLTSLIGGVRDIDQSQALVKFIKVDNAEAAWYCLVLPAQSIISPPLT